MYKRKLHMTHLDHLAPSLKNKQDVAHVHILCQRTLDISENINLTTNSPYLVEPK